MLSALEIGHFFTLDEQELARVRERRGPLNRLALALHVGFLKMTGNTLNSVERIPPDILEHLGRQLNCTPPQIASIRAFYRRRRRTLFEHHAAALRLLGRRELSPHAERGLVAHLRREAAAMFDQADLMACARTWLVEHDYLLLRERDIRRHVIAARRNHEQILFSAIAEAVPAGEREPWVPRLLALIEGGEMSHLEWLGVVPSSRATKGLEEQIEKLDFLKQLGAGRLILPDLPLAGLEHFARRMASRKPAALARVKDPHRTIEVGCFMRLTMLRVTDASVTLLDHRIAALWRAARERAGEARASRLRRLRELLDDLAGLAGDETLDAAQLRSRLNRLIAPFEPERQATQVSAIRQELGKSQDLGRLLRTARSVSLAVPADHQLTAAFATLDGVSASPTATLPAAESQPFGVSWQRLVELPDRAAALGCFRAATLMALKRALRNRSVSVTHSLSYRAPEDKLIPLNLWQRNHGRFIQGLNLPAGSEQYLQRLEAALTAGMAALAEAVEAGTVAIDGDELRLPRRQPGPLDSRIRPARQAFARAIGEAQFPDVLMEIDGLTCFSWILLGRPARSEQELVTLYAALLGLGSDLSVAEITRMVTPVAADGLGQMCSGSKPADDSARPTTQYCALCASTASPPFGDAVCSLRLT